ncbi:MAG TPA: FG-GAP-like repeat-containing protein, partial [Planctomycetota bacterium]|nr:FG-GAP-like repeat-containing protein [Planctomycetota bacterium]
FAHELQACDIDDDGDQDILVAGSGVAEPVWMNDGQGNFTDSGPLVPGSSRTVAVGDVDAYGDRDLILSDIYSGGVNIMRSE